VELGNSAPNMHLIMHQISPRRMAKNNVKQRGRQKLLGGITGRGFMPGVSGNPKGRPRVHGMLEVLRIRVSDLIEDSRTIEEHLVDALIFEALQGKNRLAAIQAIFDRLEGKPNQRVDVNIPPSWGPGAEDQRPYRAR
jgi:hypothetical protein